jgi:crotonobetainyl-CoA:carnitine CoA-transferase CaiB-like acyl-CoA transferase
VTGTSREVKRLRERLDGLRARQARVETEAAAPTQIGVAEVSEIIDRIQVRFPDKPSKEVRDQLRGAGLLWSPREMAWQRKNLPGVRARVERDVRAIFGPSS